MPTLAFLLYDNRSGSTLLSALMNRYRGVAVAQESDFVYQILEYPHPLGTPAAAAELAAYLLTRTRLPELGLDADGLRRRMAGAGSRAALIEAVASVYFGQRDPAASCWVIKDPRLYFHLGTLHRLFPAARFVQVVRDGRAVFASKRRSRSVFSGEAMDDNLVNAARRWRTKLALAERFGPGVTTVRYEDVVLGTEQALARVLDALGVPPSERVQTKEQAAYAGEIGGDYRGLHTNVAADVKEEVVSAWRRSLPREDVYLYERLNGAALRGHGYALAEADASHGARFLARVAARAAGYGLALAARKLRVALTQARAGQLGDRLRAKRVERHAGRAPKARSGGPSRPAGSESLIAQ